MNMYCCCQKANDTEDNIIVVGLKTFQNDVPFRQQLDQQRRHAGWGPWHRAYQLSAEATLVSCYTKGPLFDAKSHCWWEEMFFFYCLSCHQALKSLCGCVLLIALTYNCPLSTQGKIVLQSFPGVSVIPSYTDTRRLPVIPFSPLDWSRSTLAKLMWWKSVLKVNRKH